MLLKTQGGHCKTKQKRTQNEAISSLKCAYSTRKASFLGARQSLWRNSAANHQPGRDPTDLGQPMNRENNRNRGNKAKKLLKRNDLIFLNAQNEPRFEPTADQQTGKCGPESQPYVENGAPPASGP
jgi:hypothetical protein